MKRRGERGQATVEFALIIPLVLLVVLVLVQVVVVAHAQLAVTHLARETARAVAVDPTVDVGLLIQNRALLGTDDLVIEIFFEPSPVAQREFVVVVVSYETPAVFRGFESIVAQFRVKSQVRMLVES